MRARWAEDAAAAGVDPRKRPVPHRTIALSLAAEVLPALLNGRVQKTMYFSNAGVGKSAQGRWEKTGEPVNVVIEGRGGELAVTERIQYDSAETALNYALALLLAKNHEFGIQLCRCHADDCGRFWLVPEQLESKPSRNFCSLHETDKKKLSDRERQQRRRASNSAKRTTTQRRR
jgi:hypothetical protein